MRVRQRIQIHAIWCQTPSAMKWRYKRHFHEGIDRDLWSFWHSESHIYG